MVLFFGGIARQIKEPRHSNNSIVYPLESARCLHKLFSAGTPALITPCIYQMKSCERDSQVDCSLGYYKEFSIGMSTCGLLRDDVFWRQRIEALIYSYNDNGGFFYYAHRSVTRDGHGSTPGIYAGQHFREDAKCLLYTMDIGGNPCLYVLD